VNSVCTILLEGSTRKAGNQVRITVQLVDATVGANLWTQSYDRPFQDLLSLQDEIVKSHDHAPA
jgi:adenylate cyclase